MKWSKLKQQVEARFADSVQGRVEIFSTKYNSPRSSSGRGWITIDGIEIVNFSTMKSANVYGCIYHEATPTDCVRHPAVQDESRIPGNLIEEGEFSRFDLHNCCFEFLGLSIDDAIGHDSPLINMLAVLDSRFGKRRMTETAHSITHPLVKKLLEFRAGIEGVRLPRERRA